MLTYFVSESNSVFNTACGSTTLLPWQCSSWGRCDGAPSISNFLMDHRTQDHASIPPGSGTSRNFILSCCSSCRAQHWWRYCSLITIIILRDSINFQTRRRLFYVTALDSRDGSVVNAGHGPIPLRFTNRALSLPLSILLVPDGPSQCNQSCNTRSYQSPFTWNAAPDPLVPGLELRTGYVVKG